MKTELAYYTITPKILPAGQTSTIHITPRGRHAAFDNAATYNVLVVPISRNAPRPGAQPERYNSPEHLRNSSTEFFGGIWPPQYPAYPATAQHGALAITHCFAAEQQYMLRISKEGDEHFSLEFRVYALEPDLFALRPYKACLHSHSYRSDGREAPEIVAANYRRAGYDILSLTDHGQYTPSLEMIDAYKGIAHDMLLLQGEEVHAPGSNIHVLSIGAQYNISRLWEGGTGHYLSLVQQMQTTLDIPDPRDSFEYASALCCFKEISQAGGISILAHPNWIWQDTYNIPPALTLRFIQDKKFDALELVNGGNTPPENEEQTALWQQARTNGCNVCVVGSDDSHGTVNGEWFDIAKTYLLAAGNSRDEVLQAIKSGYSVAVLQYPKESARFYGEYRLVSYISFLHDEYFPLHDELCAEEGRLMNALQCGDADAAQRLALCTGQTARLLNQCFGTSL